MTSKQRLELKQNHALSPQQIQFLELVQLPIVSLEKRIEEEIEENPALNEEEEPSKDSPSSFRNSSSKMIFDEFQITDDSNSLEEYLLKQLIDLNLKDDILFLVKYLINSLDESGFLNRDLYSISSDLLANYSIDVSEKNLELALDILKKLEPVGVGSKNLQDCLLLQLKKRYPDKKIAYQIISEFYLPFSNKNFELIKKKLKVSEQELTAAYSLIERLNPIPSSGFSKNNAPTEYIYPDFIITNGNNDIQLQLNKGAEKTLVISKYYTNLLSETKDEKTKDFLTKKIEKARWFKESMIRREATLKKVMKAIISWQKEYLTSGNESDLKPMKLADIADIVKMDISTVSRVSNSKFVETNFGTFKVKEFFSDAFRKDNGEVVSTKKIKLQLKDIILNENKKKPFTDNQLSSILGKEEYHIARRTVAKYRTQLGIETAKLRRVL